MTWFFDQTYRSSNTFDYGVQSFTSTKVKLPPDTTGATDGYRTIVGERVLVPLRGRDEAAN